MEFKKLTNSIFVCFPIMSNRSNIISSNPLKGKDSSNSAWLHLLVFPSPGKVNATASLI